MRPSLRWLCAKSPRVDRSAATAEHILPCMLLVGSWLKQRTQRWLRLLCMAATLPQLVHCSTRAMQHAMHTATPKLCPACARQQTCRRIHVDHTTVRRITDTVNCCAAFCWRTTAMTTSLASLPMAQTALCSSPLRKSSRSSSQSCRCKAASHSRGAQARLWCNGQLARRVVATSSGATSLDATSTLCTLRT